MVQPGQRAVLEVRVSGKPLPEVTWTKDGRSISDETEGVTIGRQENRHTLTIENG